MINRLRWLVTVGVISCSFAAVAQTLVEQPNEFKKPHKERKSSSDEAIREFEAPSVDTYTLDDGDELSLTVWGRPELTGKHVVGPDGRITIPLIGTIGVAGKTREEAQELLRSSLANYYENLEVTLSVDHYSSFRVLVLGRVGVPGPLSFDRQPTLLDVLTRADGLPIGGNGTDKTALVRCAIMRGRDKMIWVDLNLLLSQGRMDLNIRLARNDLVYLPDANDQLVYVLGFAHTPGAFHLTPEMSFMDAVALAGGPTQEADLSNISLIRTRNEMHQQISLKDFLNGKTKQNFSLEEGDIIYVPQRGIAKLGYVLEKLSPLTGIAILGNLAKP